MPNSDDWRKIKNKALLYVHVLLSKQQQKTMINTLHKHDSTTTIDSAKIKKELAEHFKQRWNCTSTLSASSLEQYLADIPTILESNEYTPIDNLKTKDEIKLAINSLNPNTSPGSDGLTLKFFKTWSQFLAGYILFSAFNCFSVPLSHSVYRG